MPHAPTEVQFIYLLHIGYLYGDAVCLLFAKKQNFPRYGPGKFVMRKSACVVSS